MCLKENFFMTQKNFVHDFKNLVPAKNDSGYKRILTIGDIHGNFSRLMSLWEKIKVTDDDFVIFLGDYIDRGDEVDKVLNWAMKLNQKKNIIFLRGNHEQMMIYANEFVLENPFWLRNGGDKTYLAIEKMKSEDEQAKQKVLDFAKSLPLSYKIKIGGKIYFFCHAGIDVNKNLDEQDEESLLWAREEFFNKFDGDEVIVSGHSPVQYFFTESEGKPFRVPNRNVLMLDTGSYFENGCISCVDILSGEFWQSDLNKTKIAFVCSGNACRSPMAKFIMRKFLKNENLENKIYVDSAGCHTRGGGRMSRDAREMLKKYKIDFDKHISKRFTAEDYKNFDYIIALDEEIFHAARKISHGDKNKKIRLFKNFDGENFSVDDPYITRDYNRAFNEIYGGCSNLLRELKLRK